MWNEAQAATERAKADHEAAPPGPASAPVEIPFADPGAEKRHAAQDMLHRARKQLIEAGDRAEASVAGLERSAPAQPGLLGQAGEWVSEFGTGLGEWVGDLGEIATNLDQIPETLSAAKTDPMGFAKNLVSWDKFHTNPARWAGHVVPDAALTLVGGAGAAKKGAGLAKGFTAAGRANRILDKAKHNGKGIADHIANKGTDIGRKPDRNKKMPIRLVDDAKGLDKVWNDLSRGGTPLQRPGYEKIVQMPDGSTIGYRLKPSQGELGNTLDIRDAANNPLSVIHLT